MKHHSAEPFSSYLGTSVDMKPGSEQRLGDRYGTMMDFWRWAFGDLRSNNVRGVFAEWMVAEILGLKPNPRGSWDDYDILLSDGRTVEVKASAYLQVWHAEGDAPSLIQFTGLRGQRWIDATRRNAAEKTFNADLYVFCVQTEKDRAKWDALDLSQWSFYVVPRAKLEAYGSSSLRLSTVQTFSERFSADDLAGALNIPPATPSAD